VRTLVGLSHPTLQAEHVKR